MIFDYNPITGLNYHSVPNHLFELNITLLPPSTKDYSTEELIEMYSQYIKQQGIKLIDSDSRVIKHELYVPIISNVFNEIF